MFTKSMHGNNKRAPVIIHPLVSRFISQRWRLCIYDDW